MKKLYPTITEIASFKGRICKARYRNWLPEVTGQIHVVRSRSYYRDGAYNTVYILTNDRLATYQYNKPYNFKKYKGEYNNAVLLGDDSGYEQSPVDYFKLLG